MAIDISVAELGDVTVTIDGKAYRFVLSVNAICDLERMYSTPEKRVAFPQLATWLMAGDVTVMRSFILASLKEHHPEMTEKDAGKLMQQMGGLQGTNRLAEALSLSAVPDARDLKELQDTRPTKADRPDRSNGSGTGVSAISMPARSA